MAMHAALAAALETVPRTPPVVVALEASPAWAALWQRVDEAVVAVLREDVDEATAGVLIGESALRGHRLGQVSERCVERLTFDGLFQGPVADIVPLADALRERVDDPRVFDALDDQAPVEVPAEALASVADATLGDARFDDPTALVWEPVERVLIWLVDDDLEQRFGFPVEY